MQEEKNVGTLDSIVRIILGISSVTLLVLHFIDIIFLPIYLIILLVILVPLFLKTGTTRVCPIMKALNISTLGTKSEITED